jgi:hypothetical protein
VNSTVTDAELERDDIARTFTCPRCGAGPGERCQFGWTSAGHPARAHSSHEARYNLAAAAGLVPALPGAR